MQHHHQLQLILPQFGLYSQQLVICVNLQSICVAGNNRIKKWHQSRQKCHFQASRWFFLHFLHA